MELLTDSQLAHELIQRLGQCDPYAATLAKNISWQLSFEDVPRYSLQELELMGFSSEIAYQMEDAYRSVFATVNAYLPTQCRSAFENTDAAKTIVATVFDVLSSHEIEFAYLQTYYTGDKAQVDSRSSHRTAGDQCTSVVNQAVSAGKPGSSPLVIWQNLRFRSKQEALVAQALDKFFVLFLPNCKARLGYPDNKENREPDFLVCHKGKWGILEIDHEETHPVTRTAQDHKRDRLFKTHGIRVIEHYENVNSLERAYEVVREFLTILNQSYD